MTVMTRKVLVAIGIFATVMTCLVGLGVLVEFIITLVIFMALPAAMITFTKLKY